MKHSFHTHIIADIELSDDEFNFIFQSCQQHYDYKIKSLAKSGGFIYGFKNRREFSKDEDKILDLNFRQIDLLCKSLEYSQEDIAYEIHKNFKLILDSINTITFELNQQLEKQKS